MINQNFVILRRFELIADLALTALAFHLAFLIPEVIPFEPHFKVIPEALYSLTLVLILLIRTVILLLSPDLPIPGENGYLSGAGWAERPPFLDVQVPHDGG